MKLLMALLLVPISFITSCAVGSGNGQPGPLIIQEQGSFAVGGTVVTNPGTFDPVKMSSEGQTFHDFFIIEACIGHGVVSLLALFIKTSAQQQGQVLFRAYPSMRGTNQSVYNLMPMQSTGFQVNRDHAVIERKLRNV